MQCSWPIGATDVWNKSKTARRRRYEGTGVEWKPKDSQRYDVADELVSGGNEYGGR